MTAKQKKQYQALTDLAQELGVFQYSMQNCSDGMFKQIWTVTKEEALEHRIARVKKITAEL